MKAPVRVGLPAYLVVWICSFGVSLVRAAEPDLGKALCGNPPVDAQSTQAEEEKLHAIEKEMPPVKNQNPAPWCYAFSATDILDYYIHQKTGQPYSDTTKVSPIDAVAAEKAYLSSSKNPPPAHPGEIDLDEGGNSSDLFSAAQNRMALRSLEEIDFTPLDRQDPKSRAVIDSIFEEYKRRMSSPDGTGNCPVSERDPAFQSQLASFQLINREFYQWALENHLTDAGGTSIDDYESLASKKDRLSRIPKVQIPPFQQNVFRTEDPSQYVSRLSETLGARSPVSVDVCYYDMPASGRPPSDDSCGIHAMTAVGEAWVNGSCVIRLRNSFGKNWGNDAPPTGYVDLPVAQFVKAALHYKSTTKDETLDLFWVSDAPSSGSKKERLEISGKYVMEGEFYPNHALKSGTETHPDGAQLIGTFKPDGSPIDMLKTMPNGSSIQYRGGKMVSVANYLYPDGSRYTGTLQADGTMDTGVDTEKDGSVYHFRDGSSVSVENISFDGGLFTGTVAVQGTSVIPLQGTILMPNGAVRKYKSK